MVEQYLEGKTAMVTGGASGSDEYAELYNAGASAAELGGLELVYVSASGKSVTRKRTWSDRTLCHRL